MTGETNLATLLATMQPVLNDGDYVFCALPGDASIDTKYMIGSFREEEGLTVILHQAYADQLQLTYSFVAAWITLTVHSSLEAVGLTAAFSKALSEAGISCNVVAAFYHDHIFVAKEEAGRAMKVLQGLTKTRQAK